MKGSKTKDNLKAKVIESKINNPDKTLKEIEKETGVNYETARKIIKEDLPEVVKSSEVISKLIDDNNKLLNITGAMLLDDLFQRIDNGEEVRKEDLIKIRDLALKQNTLVGLGDDDKKEIKVTFEI